MTKVIRAKSGTRPIRAEITAGFDETGAVVTVDNAHHEVHAGNMYIVHKITEDLANDGSLDIVLKPTTIHAHAVWFHAAGGNAIFRLYENPALSDDGTVLPVYNVNRESGNISTVAVYHTPTVSGVGTEIVGHIIPGGTGGNASGAMLRSNTEMVLAKGRTYLFRLTNVSGQAKDVSIVIEFYEEE